jgi:proteasome maturation protein
MFASTNTNNSISQLHLDILNGNDEAIEPRDFLPCMSFRPSQLYSSVAPFLRVFPHANLLFYALRSSSVFLAEASGVLPDMHTVMERRLGL